MKIGAFSWVLGKSTCVDKLPELNGDEQKIAGLKKLGLEYYRVANSPCRDMMIAAITESIQLSGCDSLEIDTVLFSTSKHDDRRDISLIPEVLSVCGLLNARPLGVSLGACANLTYAFEVCEGLLKTNRSKNILMVFSDFYGDHERLLRQNAALGSDGVGACVISDNIGNGYLIKSTSNKYNVNASNHLLAEDIVSFIRTYSEGVRLSTEQAVREANICISDCNMLVAPNFNAVVLRNISKICGLKSDRIYNGNIKSVGHCSSVDQLMSLSQILAFDLPNGTPVLVSCPADFVWGSSVMVVDKHTPGVCSKGE
ncbi:3-oxoacyl-[acyl-carrier-protein] synthase III [Thalassolituus maritimus]|uniref:3-oxoacyl-[acyl-carrier-protein] synthase III n=1 Tax=Thalassolituus maritimus TaxID=484498 RepID=A0A1N7Q9G5_9GAMM|nr:hypothetical protein [Thalassolituus maritimus]SIT19389.1 3-oxoacyl-[acyl-carrier-protein] synthase III [Thalassolituus maritimus]